MEAEAEDMPREEEEGMGLTVGARPGEGGRVLVLSRAGEVGGSWGEEVERGRGAVAPGAVAVVGEGAPGLVGGGRARDWRRDGGSVGGKGRPRLEAQTMRCMATANSPAERRLSRSASESSQTRPRVAEVGWFVVV